MEPRSHFITSQRIRNILILGLVHSLVHIFINPFWGFSFFVMGMFLLRRDLFWATGVLLSALSTLSFLAVFIEEGYLGVVVLADFLWIVSLLYQVHYPAGYQQSVWALLKNVLRLSLMMAFVLVAVLAIFPKISIDFFPTPVSPTTGFSGSEMSPGEIGQLSKSQAIAFWVRFSKELKGQDLYWRGGVLSYSPDGLHWFRRRSVGENASWQKNSFQNFETSAEILLEPHVEKDLFTLDYTYHLDLKQRLFYQIQFDFRSPKTELSGPSREVYLKSPPLLSPAVRALVHSLLLEHPLSADDPQPIANRIFAYFNQEFRYRLDPGEMKTALSKEDIEEFLIRRKEGFCEHFAGSFATLMRLAGVPTRVVIGFQGGEYLRSKDLWVVRDQDAHAWAEAWSEVEHRWIRFDPTEVVAPLRLQEGSQGFRDFLLGTPVWFKKFRDLDLWIRGTFLKWPSVNQSSFDLRVPLLACVLAIGVIALGWTLRRKRRDPVIFYYYLIVKNLGLDCNPTDGPLDLLKKFNTDSTFQRVTQLYILRKYGDQTILNEDILWMRKVLWQVRWDKIKGFLLFRRNPHPGKNVPL